MSDKVDPNHYRLPGGLQVYDLQVMLAGVDGFVSHAKQTALKYIFRAGHKPGTPEAEDLRKAAHYLTRAAAALEEKHELV